MVNPLHNMARRRVEEKGSLDEAAEYAPDGGWGWCIVAATCLGQVLQTFYPASFGVSGCVFPYLPEKTMIRLHLIHLHVRVQHYRVPIKIHLSLLSDGFTGYIACLLVRAFDDSAVAQV